MKRLLELQQLLNNMSRIVETTIEVRRSKKMIDKLIALLYSGDSNRATRAIKSLEDLKKQKVDLDAAINEATASIKNMIEIHFSDENLENDMQPEEFEELQQLVKERITLEIQTSSGLVATLSKSSPESTVETSKTDYQEVVAQLLKILPDHTEIIQQQIQACTRVVETVKRATPRKLTTSNADDNTRISRKKANLKERIGNTYHQVFNAVNQVLKSDNARIRQALAKLRIKSQPITKP